MYLFLNFVTKSEMVMVVRGYKILYRVHLVCAGFELLIIHTYCIVNYKSNYNRITITPFDLKNNIKVNRIKLTATI
jgi:hypothetical protein